MNNREHPRYSIQVISEKIVKESKDKSSLDFLISGIDYMRQAGVSVPQFTKPLQYQTPEGNTFCTSELQILVDGHTFYQRHFVIKRQEDFLIITGSFPERDDYQWMTDVVDSIDLF